MNSHEKNEERCDEKSGVTASQFVIALLGMLVLYVLSVGPVVRLALEEKIPFGTVEAMYAPLEWATETSIGKKTLEPFFEWYGFELWKWHFDFAPGP